MKGFLAGVDDRRNLLAGKQRRCPATKVDRVGAGPSGCAFVGARCPCRCLPSCPRDLSDQGPNVLCLEIAIEQTAIEVAVVADCGAEGDVDVETQHWN